MLFYNLAKIYWFLFKMIVFNILWKLQIHIIFVFFLNGPQYRSFVTDKQKNSGKNHWMLCSWSIHKFWNILTTFLVISLPDQIFILASSWNCIYSSFVVNNNFFTVHQMSNKSEEIFFIHDPIASGISGCERLFH